MKVCIILYHSDILKKYKLDWIKKCILSLKNQSYTDYHIYELNYENKDTESKSKNISLLKTLKIINESNYTFINKHFTNHIHAQNFLLDKCFEKDNYDIVFNCNIDDYYHTDKLGKQIDIIKKYNIDYVSSFFNIFQMNVNKEIHNKKLLFDETDVEKQQSLIRCKLLNNKYIIENSGCCISKSFYLKNKKKQLYPNIKHMETLFMCKNAIKHKCRFYIINDLLTYKRIHINQETYKYR